MKINLKLLKIYPSTRGAVARAATTLWDRFLVRHPCVAFLLGSTVADVNSMRLSLPIDRWWRGIRRIDFLQLSVWGYLAFLIAVVAVLHLCADRWWFGTVLAYSPRWVVAWPSGILLPFALVWRRRLCLPLVAGAVIILIPIMGWELPTLSPAANGDHPVRIVTCNVGGGHVEAWQIPLMITRHSPDVVMLQECASELQINWPQGWSEIRAGGLLIASRFPLQEAFQAANNHPPSPWPPVNGLVCRIKMAAVEIAVCNVHLLTPREGLTTVADRWILINPSRKDAVEREIVYRDAESRELRAQLADLRTPLIVAGDFNMSRESKIYCDHWGDLTNAFSERGWGFGYTKTTWFGPIHFSTRIDHVLASSEWAVDACWTDKDIGSDHLPLIADLTVSVP